MTIEGTVFIFGCFFMCVILINIATLITCRNIFEFLEILSKQKLGIYEKPKPDFVEDIIQEAVDEVIEETFGETEETKKQKTNAREKQYDEI